MDVSPREFVRDPVLLEFLGLPNTGRLLESKLEEALIENLQAFFLELGSGFNPECTECIFRLEGGRPVLPVPP